ncbi:MAG: hypothetical protein ABIA04_13490 [Pseudomonadota bacterium]
MLKKSMAFNLLVFSVLFVSCVTHVETGKNGAIRANAIIKSTRHEIQAALKETIQEELGFEVNYADSLHGNLATTYRYDNSNRIRISLNTSIRKLNENEYFISVYKKEERLAGTPQKWLPVPSDGTLETKIIVSLENKLKKEK